jgi:hypothetical protein
MHETAPYLRLRRGSKLHSDIATDGFLAAEVHEGVAKQH